MSITLTALQKQRRDTAANWTSANPTLLAGEIGLESDTGYWKVGDGSTAWTSLAYVSGLGAEIPVSRLADGSARQLLQTAANGTDVEWTSNVDVPGTLDVTGAATFDGNVTVQGDLTVNGTTTTIDTTNLAIEDKNIEIGKVATPTDVTADGGGITLKGTTDKTINWVDATDAWTFSEHVNIASGKEYRINGTKVLDATSLGSNVLITSSNITDGTIVNGDINASAAIAGTKISPDFGSQTVTTTGVISAALGAAATPSLTFTGDLNTGIYSPGADQVAISTNGSGRLFVDSSGRVGVGASNPGYPLDVLSESAGAGLRIRAGSGGASVLQFTDNAISTQWGAITTNSTSTSYEHTGVLLFKTGSSERLRITSAGLVGIGTSSPGAILHALGTQTAGTIRPLMVDNASGSGTSLAGISFANSGNIKSSINAAVLNDDYMTFCVGGSGATERVRIDGSGRVGIGTTSPSAHIHISSGGNTETVIDASSAGSPILSMLATGAGSGIVAYQNNLRFGTATGVGAAGYSEKARLDSSGRWLLGTSTARGNFFNTTGQETSFQVEGTTFGGTSASIVRNSNNSSEPYLILGKTRGTAVGGTTVVNASDSLGTITFQGSDGTELVEAASITAVVDGTPGANDMPGRLVFSTTADGASSPTERMRIANDGKINTFQAASGFLTVRNAGSSASDSAFIVYKSATNTGDGTACMVIRQDGDLENTNNSYGALSDVKLKENIVSASSQWGDIKALKVRKYNFKEETGHQTHTQIGLIAQEVELISPGLVSESPDRDEDGNDLGTVTKSVNYSVLYMKAVKALQEAMERIEQLEAKVAALESA